ncbi:hypothetical protein Ae201684_018217 [Aphanomyces euteiches]|uniref:SAM domain-containing protein n=1 Tax=Aphanomyces euteiches TaxID=100861 RepID=A0A6G0W6S4_9STRA|nr:hypothetical protein Ae201684_018217 [Aphanomyces euteiches]KAH9156372.1 hypothetical protein AeRB84_001716 [Aphanomyces euteiches]
MEMELSFQPERRPDELLDAGSPTGTLLWTPLQYACAVGNITLATTLIQQGSNNVVHHVGQTKGGYTALHIAAKFGSTQLVQLLLTNGASVDSVDAIHGFTALHLAAALGHLQVVSLLLNAHAAQIPSKAGTLPIECARVGGHSDIVALLAPYTVPSTTKAEATPLHAWLSAIGLNEYTDKFVAAGFDDLAFISEHGLTMNDLIAIGVTKRGHQVKLKRLYRIDEFVEDGDETESDNEEESSEEDEDDENDATAD